MIAALFQGQMKGVVWILLGVIMLAAAACTGTGAPSGTPGPETTPTAGISVSPLTPSAGAPAATTEVNVSLKEWTIDLDQSTVSAGPVRFLVKNDGTMIHSLEIVGQGIDQKTNDLDPGGSATLDVQLTAGDYTLDCPIDSHADYGMKTTLTVK